MSYIHCNNNSYRPQMFKFSKKGLKKPKNQKRHISEMIKDLSCEKFKPNTPNMRNLLKTISFAILSGFILASCEGPMGLQGPVGEQGIEGQQGGQGDPGQNASCTVCHLPTAIADRKSVV